MTEGVQVCEKIRILREEFTRKGDKGKLSRLNKMLTKFTLEALPDGRNHPEKDVNESKKQKTPLLILPCRQELEGEFCCI